VSPQDFSPPPYPFLTDASGAEQAIPHVRPREHYWRYIALLAVTLVTTTIVGAGMQSDFGRNVPFDIERSLAQYAWFWRHPSSLLHGLPFSLTLMTILLAHEFGHYLASMYHGVDASLPYFIPSPFLGTFGAFIRVRTPIYAKRALFDIGAAGPIAGFIFLLPALGVGLAFSKVIPNIAHQGLIRFGAPGLELILERLIFPGVRSADIYLHPVARAAWFGMFATALNLLPIGQLDGGHILYSFFPRRHRMVSKILAFGLLPLGWLFWPGWYLWGLLMLWLGRRHPAIYDESEVGSGRRKLGWLALAIFLLCFTPAPFSEGGL